MKKLAMLLVFGILITTIHVPIVHAGESLSDCGQNLLGRVGGSPAELTIELDDPDLYGQMDDFEYVENGVDGFPWSGWRSEIEMVHLPEGLTNITANAFRDMTQLYWINIPSTVNYIGEDAFKGVCSVPFDDGNDPSFNVVWGGTLNEWKDLQEKSDCKDEILWNPTALYCLDKGFEKIELMPQEVDLQDQVDRDTAFAVFDTLFQLANTDHVITQDPTLSEGSKRYYDLDNDGTADIAADLYQMEEADAHMIWRLDSCSVQGEINLQLSAAAVEYMKRRPESFIRSLTLVFPKQITSDAVSGLSAKTYTGKPITQDPVVQVDGETLSKDVDYTLTFSNNTNAGTAAVTVTGKGSYTGSVKKTFKILPKEITPSLLLSTDAFEYDGSVHRPTVTVKDGNRTLVKDTDYTLAWEGDGKNVGDYKASVTLKGNYKGSASAAYKVEPRSLTGANVSLSKTRVTYNGKTRKPSATVTSGDTVLVKDTDYTVSYQNNKNAGQASVIITGKGNYTGEATAAFTIAKAKQPMTVKAKTVTVKYKKVKKAKQTIKISKAATIKKAKGEKSFTKKSGSKYLSINKETGKITVRKKTPKGTYKIKIKITAKGTENYKKGSKTVTVKVTVK